MASSHKINAPHASRQLLGRVVVSFGLVAGLSLGVWWNPPPLLQGWILILLLLLGGATMGWWIRDYLRTHWVLEIDGDALVATHWWDRWFGRPGQRLAVSDVGRIVVRRPMWVDVELTTGLVRLDSQDWGRSQYHELRELAAGSARRPPERDDQGRHAR